MQRAANAPARPPQPRGAILPGVPPPPADTAAPALLTPRERQRLTAYTWRYALAGLGFAPAEARRLAFLRWLRVEGRLAP